MSFELHQLFLIGLAYLLLLFGIAHLSESGRIPASLLRHPLTYVLSLGIFAGAWAFYGVFGLAHSYGWGYLSYYLGLAAAFVFAPLMLSPLLRITRLYMHSSLADLLTFRFRSQSAGSLITVLMLFAVMPLLAMQIQSVADAIHIITQPATDVLDSDLKDDYLALVFCVVITVFTISFGSRHLTTHERHDGLVAAIAFESLVKILALMIIAAVSIWQVFGSFGGLQLWADQNAEKIILLQHPINPDATRSLLLIFFSASVAMPHLFHMIFAENPSTQALRTASWGVPLLLLLMSLPVLPILWAGIALDSPLPPEYFTLGVGLQLQSPLLTTLTFIGGLSAASGAIIVTTLALASMCLKHLILPVYRPDSKRDIYRWLSWIRRLLIALIILAGYVFYRVIVNRETLTNLGMAAFIATLQFLPGVLATLYWQGANRRGLIAGLLAGFTVWALTLLLPIISEFRLQPISQQYFVLSFDDAWNAATYWSLGLNTAVFAVVSLLTRTSEEERVSAELCSTDDINRPMRRALGIQNPQEIKRQLATALGDRTAEREVNRALEELNYPSTENRPFALRRLRNRLENNLSGLLGPAVAHDMVNQLLPYKPAGATGSEDINLIEVRLENYRAHLTGLAADLDNLRRYHRQTLQDLPVGVCSLGRDREILMWNKAVAELTGIHTFEVIGSHLARLPAPWGSLLNDFLDAPEPHRFKQRVDVNGETRWINLHKTSHDPDDSLSDGKAIVLEDATDVALLERELAHSERLASIGRLAAGVAHEIGNPITGIACLAQNLRLDTDNPASLETARDILQQTERVSKIVQSLVSFSHAGSTTHPQAEPIAVARCVDEAIHLLRLNKAAKRVTFHNLCPPQLSALASHQPLVQVFVNLLSNARDASDEEGNITIDAMIDGAQLSVQVTDEGSGIPKQHQDKIFEPFFTTKDAGEGTGLGLALVYSILDEMQGGIAVESPLSADGRGTRFSVRLQLADTTGSA